VRILVIKTSSLGDIVHSLPAVTDAARALPGTRFDWVAEEAFAELPAWHPAVDAVIPVAIRRWRHHPGQALLEVPAFLRRLRSRSYDRVIDAQGLVKSAAITRLARGVRCGLDSRSAREPIAAFAYQRRFAVAREQHAVARVRRLFAASLGYPVPASGPDYGLRRPGPATAIAERPYLVLLHETTWASKRWPEASWRTLARMAGEGGYDVCLPWHEAEQKESAARIAEACAGVRLVRTASLQDLARLIGGARAVVAGDTGPAHIAAAFGVPGVVIYGATRPALTGTIGPDQIHLTADFPCSPCRGRTCRYKGPAEVRPACYATVPPAQVWESLRVLADPRDARHPAAEPMAPGLRGN
jgi:heptosyltransferase-1